tara:strand:- start:399 stop:2684 length:2286 start_codon:yes stop_codon:yes gene_type:complete
MIHTYGSNGNYHGFQTLAFEDFGFHYQPPDPTPPRARHSIGVNQPPNGGNDYPFVRPSPDVYFLLGDFYLSYADDTCSYAYPFRIEWMYGFGTRQYSESGSEVDPLPGYPTPTHEYDILVKDANNVTVFDSTVVGTGDDADNVSPFKWSEWYSRYVVIEWTDKSKDIVCRCTKFIGWDSYSTDYQEYDEYIVPVYSTGTVTDIANSGGKTKLTVTYDQSGALLQVGDVVYVKETDVPGYNVAHTVVTELGGKITDTTGDTISPISVISNNHGLSTGDQVYINDVEGNTAANGTFIVTNLEPNVFTLDGSTGNGAYTKGGTWRAPTKVVTDIAYSQAITTAGIWQDPGGILDPRTYNKLPLRVRSLTVRGIYGDLGTVLQGNISFHSNYNIELQDNPASIGFIDFNAEELGFDSGKPVIEGSRLVNRIAINSEPGLGTGTFPSCNPDDVQAPLRRLNNTKADDTQNITLDSGVDCIRLQRPVTLVNDCPRQFEFDATVTPDGAITNRFVNDCVSCCDCDYFARTYQGLKRQWNAYQVIADDTIEARDQFEQNVTRWNYQKECRESNPVMLIIRVLPNCTVDVGVTFGNTSGCCLVDVHMRLTFEYYNGSEWVIYPTDDLCDEGIIRSMDVKLTQDRGEVKTAVPIGKFPVIDILADYLPPSATFQVAAKLCFPGCIPASQFRCHVHIWWEHTINSVHLTCDYPDAITVDASVLAIWSATSMDVPPYDITYAVSSPTKDLNTSSAFCTSDNASCERPPECSIG